MRPADLYNSTSRERRGRLDRASSVHVAWVCVLALLLVLGSFGGVSFFAHAHDGHGLHVHAAATETEATRLASLHVEHHRSHSHDHGGSLAHDESSCEHGSFGHDEVPKSDPTQPVDGVLVSLPDCDVVKVPPTGVPQFPMLVGEFVSLGLSALAAAIQVEPSAECFEATRPKHLSDLCPCARIVRTSGALLI